MSRRSPLSAVNKAKSDIAEVDPSEPGNLDLRDTDHPTGTQQAAENAPTTHQASSKPRWLDSVSRPPARDRAQGGG
jgi:hypothetical protein